MEAILEKTSRKDQKIAKASILKVHEASRKISNSSSDAISIKIDGKGDSLEIPRTALFLLFDILDNMAEGKSIALILSNAEVSTQQAADLLNVSRPHIVNLLEKGEIPFKKVGVHRRIQLKDLVAYDKKIKKNRTEKLDFLTKQAQDLNLGY